MENNPTVVMYDLEAGEFGWNIAPGKTVGAWGFNRQVPGPVLKAKKGDTLVVRVKNNLPEPTIVHWHGIRLPAAMDGTGDVQKPIQPGEVFEYRFVVPDAGTFWYHSHANETVQMERGMYGALIVEDDADPVFDQERVLMFDDMKLTADNQFTEPGGLMGRWNESHFGREGDTMLINGKETPVLEMAAGQVERWRFINASSARYIQLSIGGQPFRMIGTDGGLLETPRTITEYLLAPGERIDAAVGPFSEGETISIESLPYKGNHGKMREGEHYGTVRIGQAIPSKAFLPEQLRNIESLAAQDAPVTRKMKITLGMSLKNGFDFQFNRKRHAMDQPVRVGELQIWEVNNRTLMHHPFHLHGFFFQVLEVDGKAPEYQAWKDTFNIAPRSTIKIAWMPDNRPGMWMYHCHVLEHHAAGMMAGFEVVDGSQPARHQHHNHHH